MQLGDISYIDGFEGIWLLWLASILVLVVLTIVAIKRLGWQQAKQVASGEDGAAYTLSYVIVMPIYTLFVCLVIETSFMLVAKIGTVYAAFAAARTGIVWYSADDEATAREMSRSAGVRSFVPFASGLTGLNADAAGGSNAQMDQYVAAYQDFVKQTGSQVPAERYLRGQYRYANTAVDVGLELEDGPSGNAWDQNLVATVAYSYPFSVAGIGRILGERGPTGGFVYRIASQVKLQIEHPWNEEKRHGISYASPD